MDAYDEYLNEVITGLNGERKPRKHFMSLERVRAGRQLFNDGMAAAYRIQHESLNEDPPEPA